VTTFYAVSAGAAATLVGLLFVAVQFSLPAVSSKVFQHRQATARSTYLVFFVLFVLSLVLLIPDRPSFQAQIVIAGAVIGLVRAVRAWIPVWRGMAQGRIEARVWQTAWHLIGPLTAYAGLIRLSLEQLLSRDSTLLAHGASYVFIFLFIIGIRNSWNLLFEAAVSAAASRQADPST
jgi:hypothetical protein